MVILDDSEDGGFGGFWPTCHRVDVVEVISLVAHMEKN